MSQRARSRLIHAKSTMSGKNADGAIERSVRRRSVSLPSAMFLFSSILLLPIAVRAFSSFQRQNVVNTVCLKGGASTESGSSISISIDSLANKKVLVVGGSGRVGGSVVTQLVQHKSRVTVGGTNVNSFQTSRARWNTMFTNMQDVEFCALNKENVTSIASVLENDDYDLVVHTAGPFQGKVDVPNGVLEACVANSVPYIDVCDDYCTARAAKAKFGKVAQEGGVPCIISTGCWVRASRFILRQVLRVRYSAVLTIYSPECLLSWPSK